MSEVTQSCPTLRDPMDCSLTGYSVHGIFQARVLEWVAIAFSTYIYTHTHTQKYILVKTKVLIEVLQSFNISTFDVSSVQFSHSVVSDSL